MSHKVDWKFWSQMQEIKLWQAVFLSINVDPNEADPEYEHFDDLIQEYPVASKRLKLVKSNLGRRLTLGTLNMGDSNLHGVQLREVAALAVSDEWENLPTVFSELGWAEYRKNSQEMAGSDSDLQKLHDQRVEAKRKATNPEDVADWWNASMDASTWWQAESISPINAAMLLARHNPNTKTIEDAETNSSNEMGPRDFRALKNIFEGAINDRPRALKYWMEYAQQRGLRIHSWLGEWLQAMGDLLPSSLVSGAVASESQENIELVTLKSLVLYLSTKKRCSVSDAALEIQLTFARIGSIKIYQRHITGHEALQPGSAGVREVAGELAALMIHNRFISNPDGGIAEVCNAYCFNLADLDCLINDKIRPEALPAMQAVPIFESMIPTAALSSQKDDVGMTKRERQIRVIESAISKLGLSAMCIKTGEKNNVGAECKLISDLFGGGVDPFKEAWQEAVKQKRVRTARHNQYAGK